MKKEIDNTCYKINKVFGFLPIPREYIIKLLIRGIDDDTIFTMASDSYAGYKNVIKNKYYI